MQVDEKETKLSIISFILLCGHVTFSCVYTAIIIRERINVASWLTTLMVPG